MLIAVSFIAIFLQPIYYGWCGADYVEQDMKPAKLQERVEVDQENEYEKIEVPQFGPYRPGTFIHDFRQVRRRKILSFAHY